MTEFTEWLQRHDLLIDLITVWSLVAGFALFGVVKMIAWWTLHKQVDATMVGVTLKHQKLTEAFIGFGMSTLYGMTLFAYYAAGPTFSFTDRLLLRAGLFLAMLLGSFYSIQFVYHLRRETYEGGSEPKDARDNRQDTREDGLDERAIGLDRRGWGMSKESIQQEVQQRVQDEREHDLDDREEAVAARE